MYPYFEILYTENYNFDTNKCIIQIVCKTSKYIHQSVRVQQNEKQ